MLKTITNYMPLVNPRFLTASTLTLGILLPSSLLALPAVAVHLSNGQIAFNYPPRLLRAATSSIDPNAPATYYFTLSVPKNAGEPLGAVTITPRENLEKVAFNVSQSRAFIGERFARGPKVPLASIGGTQPAKSGEVTVAFNPPVQPGKTVTVALRAKKNPTGGGIYLFGIKAFPGGENSYGQFLGYGRLHFYSNSR